MLYAFRKIEKERKKATGNQHRRSQTGRSLYHRPKLKAIQNPCAGNQHDGLQPFGTIDRRALQLLNLADVEFVTRD